MLCGFGSPVDCVGDDALDSRAILWEFVVVEDRCWMFFSDVGSFKVRWGRCG